MSLKFQKARKDHKCDTCGRKIPAGTGYWRTHHEDGSKEGWKEHSNCLEYEHEPAYEKANNNTPRSRK